MENTKYILVFLSIFAIAPAFSSKGLNQINIFAQNICDKVSTTGSITKSKIRGVLEAESLAVAKLIGLNIGTNGEILIENTQYEGLPYENLSDQMSGARACRKEVAFFLLSEKTKIKEVQNKKPNYSIDSQGETIYLMKNPNFRKFYDLNKNVFKICHLFNHTPVSITNRTYNEDISFGSLSWSEVTVISGSCSGKTGWIPSKFIMHN